MPALSYYTNVHVLCYHIFLLVGNHNIYTKDICRVNTYVVRSYALANLRCTSDRTTISSTTPHPLSQTITYFRKLACTYATSPLESLRKDSSVPRAESHFRSSYHAQTFSPRPSPCFAHSSFLQQIRESLHETSFAKGVDGRGFHGVWYYR